jgi:hypothetical protein
VAAVITPSVPSDRVAVAQHLGAAGVGGQVAPDRAAALGRQAQRKEPARAFGGIAHGLQRAAGLDRQRVVVRVDFPDPVQPPSIQQHRMPMRARRSPSAQSGVAALGDDGCAAPRARLHDGGRFLRGRGQHHRIGAPREAFAPVRQERCHILGLRQHMA